MDIREPLRHIDQLEYFKMVPRASRGGTVDWNRQWRVHAVPHADHLERDRRWVRVMGGDAMDAIRAAAYWPAVAMKVDREVGTVTAGKYADIIVVRGDVLRYLDLLQNVDIVIKHGVRYK
jgi:hypothetical protein